MLKLQFIVMLTAQFECTRSVHLPNSHTMLLAMACSGLSFCTIIIKLKACQFPGDLMMLELLLSVLCHDFLYSLATSVILSAHPWEPQNMLAVQPFRLQCLGDGHTCFKWEPWYRSEPELEQGATLGKY